MENPVLLIIAGIIIFNYGFTRFLDYLNSQHRTKTPPASVKNLYSKEEYQKSQEYEKETSAYAFITSTFNTIVTLVFLLWGGFGWLDEILRNYTEHPVLLALLFFGVLSTASTIISLPFSIYETFVIEEKWGFNKTTPKTFITDLFKSAFVGAIIGGGLLALIIFLLENTGQWFLVYAWISVTLISLLFTSFYTSWLLPLFNKLTPLEDGKLKSKIIAFAREIDFPVTNIFVMDGSKRSSKANAFFSGLGKKKKIVLFDTLIDKMEEDEIIAVLAHEAGHYKKKHIIRNLISGAVNLFVVFLLLGIVVQYPALPEALGATTSESTIHLSLIAFSFLFSPVSILTGILMNAMSRKMEFEADAYAAEHFEKEHLITALKKLSRDHLSNLTPHPVYVKVYYSHPPLSERIEHLQSK